MNLQAATNCQAHLLSFKDKYLKRLEKDYENKQRDGSDEKAIDKARTIYFEFKSFVESVEALIEENVLLNNNIK